MILGNADRNDFDHNTNIEQTDQSGRRCNKIVWKRFEVRLGTISSSLTLMRKRLCKRRGRNTKCIFNCFAVRCFVLIEFSLGLKLCGKEYI